MATVQFLHDMVEGNGKTIKENNLAIEHTIPLGTLVEVDCNYIEEHGLRMFVGRYSRDCDGTPLYDLTFYSQEDIKLHIDAGVKPEIINMTFCRHFSEQSLIIIHKQ